ncbi:hypothetical protein J6B78_05425 [Methanocorpusculum sp.]|nr:hypothetical protein [Methanocorpusculum sp.]MBO5367171.1 hypothetical protein [Methanocorpusculum sp.]
MPRPVPHIREPENKKDECAEVRMSKTEDEGAVGSRPAEHATGEGATAPKPGARLEETCDSV